MKQYRFKCYAAGLKFDSVVNATNDEKAIEGFTENLNNKKYSVQRDGFRGAIHAFHLTYEELEHGTTKVDIGEATAGIQMGQPSVVTR